MVQVGNQAHSYALCFTPTCQPHSHMAHSKAAMELCSPLQAFSISVYGAYIDSVATLGSNYLQLLILN